MTRAIICGIVFGTALCCSLAGCGGKTETVNGAPPAATVETEGDVNLLQVDHPEKFPLVAATEYLASPALNATGVVGPDISRTVPVISLAAGRVVELKARLGDAVHKGQVLLKVQSPDIALAFSDYRKAVADDGVTRKQSERAQILYDKGAISLNDFQVAQNAEEKSKVDVETALEHLRVLGVDKDRPSGVVEIVAPISGVITDQQVTSASGIQGLAAANPFTISDLSKVWILCDVFENDLSSVRPGQTADIRLIAYPGKLLTGTISNIGPILDPNVRAAKVRIEVDNPSGLMKLGMFVTATFHGLKKERAAAVPATAVLHLHDKDWVYVPSGEKKFRRVEVKAGISLPGKMQEILAGINPGDQVVRNGLTMENTLDQ
jgi:membrane fusion protein, heavy metal efflux system